MLPICLVCNIVIWRFRVRVPSEVYILGDFFFFLPIICVFWCGCWSCSAIRLSLVDILGSFWMGFDVVVSNKGGVRSTPVLCTLNIYMSTLYIEFIDGLCRSWVRIHYDIQNMISRTSYGMELFICFTLFRNWRSYLSLRGSNEGYAYCEKSAVQVKRKPTDMTQNQEPINPRT